MKKIYFLITILFLLSSDFCHSETITIRGVSSVEQFRDEIKKRYANRLNNIDFEKLNRITSNLFQKPNSCDLHISDIKLELEKQDYTQEELYKKFEVKGDFYFGLLTKKITLTKIKKISLWENELNVARLVQTPCGNYVYYFSDAQLVKYFNDLIELDLKLNKEGYFAHSVYVGDAFIQNMVRSQFYEYINKIYTKVLNSPYLNLLDKKLNYNHSSEFPFSWTEQSCNTCCSISSDKNDFEVYDYQKEIKGITAGALKLTVNCSPPKPDDGEKIQPRDEKSTDLQAVSQNLTTTKFVKKTYDVEPVYFTNRNNILFVMDNSQSMREHHEELMNKSDALSEKLNHLKDETHVSVITTTPEQNSLRTNTLVFGKNYPKVSDRSLKKWFDIGTAGSPNETGTKSAIEFLGKIRPDFAAPGSRLFIVIMTDEDDFYGTEKSWNDFKTSLEKNSVSLNVILYANQNKTGAYKRILKNTDFSLLPLDGPVQGLFDKMSELISVPRLVESKVKFDQVLPEKAEIKVYDENIDLKPEADYEVKISTDRRSAKILSDGSFVPKYLEVTTELENEVNAAPAKGNVDSITPKAVWAVLTKKSFPEFEKLPHAFKDKLIRGVIRNLYNDDNALVKFTTNGTKEESVEVRIDAKFLKMVTNVSDAGLPVGTAVKWEKNPTKKFIIKELLDGGMVILEERETKALFWTKSIRLKRVPDGA